MKHLSQVPEPPSRLRPEVPHDLDLVVIRALAKEPAERYRSAQEMDRDLERVTRGEGVDRETEDAATMVMRGETTAATMVGGRTAPGYGGDERYRAYDGEVRKSRSWWPWLLALGLATRDRRRWLPPLRQRQRQARREQDGRGRQLHRVSSRARRSALIHRGRLRGPRPPGAELGGRRGLRDRAGARPRDAAPEGQHRHDRRLHGPTRGHRAAAHRQDPRRGGQRSHRPEPRGERRRGELRAGAGHRYRAGPGSRHRAHHRLDRARQRLQGHQAGRGAVRRRPAGRHRLVTAPACRVQGRTDRRRERAAGG